MKKVISALTAAAMCASMTASVMTASAVYTANDVAFYLKVVDAGNGTISADGSTVTFATAADAANAKLTIQEFIKADVSNPSVQQVSSAFTTDSTDIKLNTGLGKDATLGAEYTYTASGGREFTTNAFVTTFDYLSKRGAYTSGATNVQWGHSDNYGEGFVGNQPYDVLSYTWASSFSDNSRDNYLETAAFLGDNSDDFPLNQFTADLNGLGDGTYHITWQDTVTHPEWGVQDCNWVQVDAKNVIKITDLTGITIVVGDATATTAPTTEPPTTESQPTTTESQPTTNPKEDFDGWTWYIEDAYYDSTDPNAVAEIKLVMGAQDPGIVGYVAQLTMDGKTVPENGWDFDSIAPGDAYSFEMFSQNVQKGTASATISNDSGVFEAQVAEDGSVIAVYTIFADTVDLVPGTVYEMSIEPSNLLITDPDRNELQDQVKIVPGKLYVLPMDQPITTEPQPTTTEKQPDTTGGDQPTTAPTGDYLYGDVNENGVVELVDVVMLNRALTGYADQQLTDRAVVNANCFRANKESDADTTRADLDGKDSIEILKYLIEKITSLPTQG